MQLRHHLSEVSRPALLFSAGGTFCRLEWLWLVSGGVTRAACGGFATLSPPLTGPVEQAGGADQGFSRAGGGGGGGGGEQLHMLTSKTQYSSASKPRAGLLDPAPLKEAAKPPCKTPTSISPANLL